MEEYKELSRGMGKLLDKVEELGRHGLSRIIEEHTLKSGRLLLQERISQ